MNTDKATKVKVVADHDKNGYLTVGKTYNISRNDGEYFWINNSDIGFGVYCMWKGCFHGYEYQPVFEPQENQMTSYWDYMREGGQGDQEVAQKYKDDEGAVYSVDKYGKVTDDTGFVYNTNFRDPNAYLLFEGLEPLVETPMFESTGLNIQGKIASDGGPSDYYDFPVGCETLNDLIEYKQMSFAQGNIFKAAYRLGNKEGITLEYDLKKIKYYADRMLNQIERKKID